VETIQGINQVITQLGTEQIKTLTKIKHFRKSINYMEWESSFLKAQSHDLEEYYTDLQLLHVTKSLQSVLKGNQSTTAAPEQIAREEARISILIKANEKKLSTLTNTNSKLVQQIQAREDENKRLHLQLNQINDAIIVREAITRSQLNSFTEEANAEQRTRYHMKRITLRRRLIDLVRLIAYFFVYTISE
jgi:phospholipase/lecithinase/hemolysin